MSTPRNTSPRSNGNAVQNDSQSVVTGALPGSRKVYREVDFSGSEPLRVAMRAIDVDDEQSPHLCVYDPSGPYTDDGASIDIRRGLPRLRASWIEDRGDSEPSKPLWQGDKPAHHSNGATNGESTDVFPTHNRWLHRAKGDKAVTQLAYARRGIVTAEMAYIAERENEGRVHPERARPGRIHPGR